MTMLEELGKNPTKVEMEKEKQPCFRSRSFPNLITLICFGGVVFQ